MEINIYGLIDPRTNNIRYVGKTKNSLQHRLKQHLSETPERNTHKSNWIKSLKKEDLTPIIVQLDVCDETNWVEKEQYWISVFTDLTNLTAGGDGINFFSDEVLVKISNKVKAKWLDEEYKTNISQKRKEYWSHKENRIKHSSKVKGLKRSNEFKENLSNIKKEQWTDNDYKNKMSKQSANLWQDESYKEKTLAALRTDEYRKKMSDMSKGISKSEETKLKMSANNTSKRPVIIDGIVYDSIISASKLIPMDYSKLKVRIKSKNFQNYNYLNGGE